MVCMTGRQPPLGVIYMRPSLLAISTQGQMRLQPASQPAGQPDYDESSQDSPVTPALKATEIMHQWLYVELCALRWVRTYELRAREVEIMYGCCHAQGSLFSMGENH